MKKVLKVIFFLFSIVFIQLLMSEKVLASKATCTYKYPKVPTATITYTYEYGKKLSYSYGKNSKIQSFSNSLKNEDFISDDKSIKCPSINISTTIKDKQRYSMSVKKGNSYTGVLNLITDDGKEKDTQNNGHLCTYNKDTNRQISLSWSTKLDVYLEGDNLSGYSYKINESFSESDFADSKCPDAYFTYVAKAKNVVISKKPIMTENDKANEVDETTNLSDGSKIESNTDINMGTEVTGCEVIPIEIRKWINNILNFVKYAALALVIVLGVTDFIKAAASGEPDQMKKSGQSFIKRIAAVAILFLLPLIIELILNLVNLAGVDLNNTSCLN